MHANPHLDIVLTGKNQSQVVFAKEFLKEPITSEEQNPLRRDERVNYQLLDHKELCEKYEPVTGNFETAYLRHNFGDDGSNVVGSAYTVIVRGGTEGAAELRASLDSDEPLYKILQQNSDAHALYDRKSKTTGYVIFEPNTILSAGRDLMTCSGPAFIMVREDNTNTRSISFVNASPFAHQSVYLTLRGNWRYDGKHLLPNGAAIEVRVKDGVTTLIIGGAHIDHYPFGTPKRPRYWNYTDLRPIRLKLTRK
jgi:hypothetical protein